MKTTPYILLRLAIGMSCFGHGLVRMFKLAGFSKWMVGQFQKSYLPEALVVPFSYFLPFAELVIGLLLLIGVFTRQAAIAGAILMILLIFGTTTIENWDAIPTQLIHVAFLVALLYLAPEKKKQTPA
jgi:thiosulfate dehydrogenase (quinone) large subunit